MCGGHFAFCHRATVHNIYLHENRIKRTGKQQGQENHSCIYMYASASQEAMKQITKEYTVSYFLKSSANKRFSRVDGAQLNYASILTNLI